MNGKTVKVNVLRGRIEDQTGTTCHRYVSPSVVKTPRHLSCGQRPTIVIVCLLVNYPCCVALARAENKCRAVARVFRGSGWRRRRTGEGGKEEGQKCFLSLCAPRVTKSTTDAGPDKSCRGRAPFFFLPPPMRS